MTSLTDLFSLDGKVAIVTGASLRARGRVRPGASPRRAPTWSSAPGASTGSRTPPRWSRRPAVARSRSRPTSPPPRRARSWSTPRWTSSAGSTYWSTTPASAPPCPATRETPDQFRQVIDVNLNGCYWMAQACGRVMQPGSSIINISSVLGLTTAGLPQAAYASSKAGLIGLTRDLAQQWTGRKGIRVNAIAPGFFESEMTEQYPDGYLEHQMARIPSGRKGDPRELAATAVFLASRRGRLHHRPDARRSTAA